MVWSLLLLAEAAVLQHEHSLAPVDAFQVPVPRIAPLPRGTRAVMSTEVREAADEVQSARASGLALALDDGTRKSHSVAENTAFVTGFFKGISTRDAFGQLVADLYFVYKAQEDAFDAVEAPEVRALDYPELRRVAALEEDMAYYFGPDWRGKVKPTAATREYTERIQEIAAEAPHLLLAHMYTRYLGDLFGGQMMGGMARNSLKLDDGKGTKFYEFDDIANTKQFIEDWYTRLNALDLDDAQKTAIIDEANLVFGLNIKLFQELEGQRFGAARAALRLARTAVKSRLARLVKGR
jgi:heme oxygenase